MCLWVCVHLLDPSTISKFSSAGGVFSNHSADFSWYLVQIDLFFKNHRIIKVEKYLQDYLYRCFDEMLWT